MPPTSQSRYPRQPALPDARLPASVTAAQPRPGRTAALPAIAAAKSAQQWPGRRHLTIAEFCEELSIARSTFYEWRAKKTAPRCVKLPNGELRIRRSDFDAWLEARLDRA